MKAVKNAKTEQVMSFDDQAGVDGFLAGQPEAEREDWVAVAEEVAEQPADAQPTSGV